MEPKEFPRDLFRFLGKIKPEKECVGARAVHEEVEQYLMVETEAPLSGYSIPCMI